MLSLDKNYSRRANIIYEQGAPIIRLKQKFIDIDNLNDTTIEYMNRYLAMWPHHWELIQHEKMNKIIKMFYDVETTGTDPRKHSIHQISGCIEIDEVVVENFNFKVRPHPKAVYDEKVLRVGGVKEEDVREYPEMGIVYRLIISMLTRYVDRYNPKEKMHLVGFNNASFDDDMFRAWFEQNGDTFFGAWFYGAALDVMVLASEYLLDRRANMPNFKLKTVAKELGIEVDEERLHNAEYDIDITRQVYRIVTGREMEL
jgi:DNA polymerase III subunit epsilon